MENRVQLGPFPAPFSEPAVHGKPPFSTSPPSLKCAGAGLILREERAPLWVGRLIQGRVTI